MHLHMPIHIHIHIHMHINVHVHVHVHATICIYAYTYTCTYTYTYTYIFEGRWKSLEGSMRRRLLELVGEFWTVLVDRSKYWRFCYMFFPWSEDGRHICLEGLLMTFSELLKNRRKSLSVFGWFQKVIGNLWRIFQVSLEERWKSLGAVLECFGGRARDTLWNTNAWRKQHYFFTRRWCFALTLRPTSFCGRFMFACRRSHIGFWRVAP